MAVEEEQKGIRCDICNYWYHAQCQDLNDDLYDSINSSGTTQIHWFCKYCNLGATNVLMAMNRMHDEMNKKIGQSIGKPIKTQKQ